MNMCFDGFVSADTTLNMESIKKAKDLRRKTSGKCMLLFEVLTCARCFCKHNLEL